MYVVRTHYYICVLILGRWLTEELLGHTTNCPLTTIYMQVAELTEELESCSGIPLPTTYVSSHHYICALSRLHLCPHTICALIRGRWWRS